MNSGASPERDVPNGTLPADAAAPVRDEDLDQRRRCHHQNAPREDWAWLPTESHGHLEKHPWCAKCGMIAATGSQRALDYGGLVNELAVLERRLANVGRRITEAQKRLILRQLRELNADDRYALTRTSQARMFYHTIERYTGMTPDVLQSYIHAS